MVSTRFRRGKCCDGPRAELKDVYILLHTRVKKCGAAGGQRQYCEVRRNGGIPGNVERGSLKLQNSSRTSSQINERGVWSSGESTPALRHESGFEMIGGRVHWIVERLDRICLRVPTIYVSGRFEKTEKESLIALRRPRRAAHSMYWQGGSWDKSFGVVSVHGRGKCVNRPLV